MSSHFFRLITIVALFVSIAASQTRPAADTAKSTFAEFSGRVVDDQSGKPISDYAVQWGLADSDGAIKWGYGLSIGTPRRNGAFHEQSGWQEGQKVWVRIIADGYVPQPVTAEPAVVPAKLTGLVVRLKHGGELHGVVLDHAGKPVEHAGVFLADAQPLELTDGVAQQFKGSSATTNAAGEFVLSGFDAASEHRLIVTAGAGPVTLVSKPALDQVLTVRLPAPAVLRVMYDIADDQAEAKLRIEQKTWESPEWRGINIVREPVVANHGQIELTDLSPGTYDFLRQKMIRVGDQGHGVFCDRRTIAIKSGETQTVNLARPHGRSITGEVIGLQEAGVPGAFVVVRSPEATGDPHDIKQAELPIYDATTCTTDEGHFKTAALDPGEYNVVVEAYRPETPQERRSTGWVLPAFVAVSKVTVPADGEPEPVRIELKPYQRDVRR